MVYDHHIFDPRKALLVDLGHKSAFDLLLKEAWNPEQAAMGNSTLPTVLDKLNIMSTIHLRKLIETIFLSPRFEKVQMISFPPCSSIISKVTVEVIPGIFRILFIIV